MDAVLAQDREVQEDDEDEDEVEKEEAEREYQVRVRKATQDPHADALSSRRRPVQPRGPLATFDGVADHERWRVEVNHPDSGRMVHAGDIHADATEAEFVRKFLARIPEEPGETVSFYLTPISSAGKSLHPGGPYRTVTYDALSAEVVRQRRAPDEQGGLGGLFGGGARGGASTTEIGMLGLMQQQLEAANRRAELLEASTQAARDQLERERLALLNRREELSNSVATDLSEAYRGVHDAQRKLVEEHTKTATGGMTDLLRVQRELAEAERERLKAEKAEERERLKAEKEADVARIRAEAALQEARLTAETNLKIAQIQAEVAKAQLEAQARKEEAAERRREEAERAEKMELQRMRFDKEREDARRDERAAIEKRAEEAEKQRIAFAAEQDRQRSQHWDLMVMQLEKQNKSEASGSKLGVVGDVLDLLGMTPAELLAQGKALLSGGESRGAAVAIVDAVAKLGEALINRIPPGGDEEEEEDEDDEEGEEEEVEERPPRTARPAPRQITERRDAALTGFSRQDQDAREAREAREAVPRIAETREQPAAAPPQAPAAPAPPTGPALPDEEVRAGRDAVAALVERLEGAALGDWVAIVSSVGADTPLIDYLGKVGVRRALTDAGAPEHADTLTQVLRNLGLLTS